MDKVTSAKFHVCSHCLKIYGDHAQGKCLYEPTWFNPVDCFVCQTTDNVAFLVARMDNQLHFACIKCRNPPAITNERGRIFLHAFMLNGLQVTTWYNNGDY